MLTTLDQVKPQQCFTFENRAAKYLCYAVAYGNIYYLIPGRLEPIYSKPIKKAKKINVQLFPNWYDNYAG